MEGITTKLKGCMKKLIISSLLLGLTALSTAVMAKEYQLPADGSRLIGDNEYYVVPHKKLTLEGIAAKYQLGLTNMLEANPSADPFLPHPQSTLIIPHKLILPDAPKEGIVINVAEMRLYYYPKGTNVVEVLPIGIGQLGTDTPENWVTKIRRKKANPTWTPTAKMHKEYAARGEPLPKVWPAGPDNPMGLFAMYLGNLYAIHGTNASFGIGLRVSHGCVRLRNDDIEYLFKSVPVGTRVQFVNQPVKTTTAADGGRYVEVHNPLSQTEAEFNSDEPSVLQLTPKIVRFIAAKDTDSHTLKRVLDDRSGIPTRIN